MKTFFVAILIVITSIIFYSCKSDSPVSPGTSEQGFSWELFQRGIFLEPARYIALADENTIYTSHVPACYRITASGRTQIDFQDSLFTSKCFDVYNPSYYAYCGDEYYNNHGLTVMKIFNNSVITSVVLDSAYSNNPTELKILEPGKIAVISTGKFFLYENGNVFRGTSADTSGSGFNNLISQNGTWFISGRSGKIYKYENNSIVVANNEVATNEFFRMKINNAIIKAPYSPLPVVLSSWNGSAWTPFTSDSAFSIYYWAAGENTNLIYLLYADSALTASYGKIWTGSKLISDPYFPPDNVSQRLYTEALSNMKNGVVFISKYDGFECKIYRGRKNW
ncbi:MAG: hypothetical protein JSS63_15140 [Bacteroidetes bacterium]|nr:hypothetical protein [Bacteroidota bacterium]